MSAAGWHNKSIKSQSAPLLEQQEQYWRDRNGKQHEPHSIGQKKKKG
jgi:hypothetical protein